MASAPRRRDGDAAVGPYAQSMRSTFPPPPPLDTVYTNPPGNEEASEEEDYSKAEDASARVIRDRTQSAFTENLAAFPQRRPLSERPVSQPGSFQSHVFRPYPPDHRRIRGVDPHHLKTAGTLHSCAFATPPTSTTGVGRRQRTAFTWSAPYQSSPSDFEEFSSSSNASSYSFSSLEDIEYGYGLAFHPSGSRSPDSSRLPPSLSLHHASSTHATATRTLGRSSRFRSCRWTFRVVSLLACLQVALWSDYSRQTSNNNSLVPPPPPAAFSNQHGREVDFPLSFSSQATPAIQRMQSGTHEQHVLLDPEENISTTSTTTKNAVSGNHKRPRRPNLAFARSSSHEAARHPSAIATPPLVQEPPKITKFVLGDDEYYETTTHYHSGDSETTTSPWHRLAYIVLAGLVLEILYREVVQRRICLSSPPRRHVRSD